MYIETLKVLTTLYIEQDSEDLIYNLNHDYYSDVINNN